MMGRRMQSARMKQTRNHVPPTCIKFSATAALWFRTPMNLDARTGPFALAPLTHLLATPCLLHLRALLRSFVRSLAHSQARGKMYDWISKIDPVLFHSALAVFLKIGKMAFERNLVQAGRTVFVGDRFFSCSFPETRGQDNVDMFVVEICAHVDFI